MTAGTGPPGNGAAPRSNDREGGGVEHAGGGRTVGILAHPADEIRDLARDLVAEIAALYERAGYCDCDDDHCNFGEVSQELVYLAEDARRRLWLAELDRGRRG